jgi:primosomal protein N' (replication factor Y) (superfamily II helicase)
MIAEVIVDVQASEVDKIFDYNLPTDLNIDVGSRVFVPFGSRIIEGYIVSVKPTSILPKAKIKNVIKACDPYPIISAEMLELASFMKQQYNLKMVDILRLFLPSSMRLNKVKAVIKEDVFIAKNVDIKQVLNTIKANATKQRQLIEYLNGKKQADKILLNKKFGSSVVNKFLKIGVLQSESYEVKRIPQANLKTSFKHDVALTKEQKECVKAVTEANSQTFLLHGVTGSGKTEVYMQVISQVLKQNKTAIMLVPEISLTPQMLKNFRERFGQLVAIIHSGLSDGERYDEWRRIKEGDAKIVIGARSAIFAPIKDLGVVIIDEEHDSSYYSESNPRYFTHDIAKFRAKFNNCSLILGSATPSVESYHFAKQNEYKLLELPFRVNKREMPTLKIVDMQAELMLGNTSMFSSELKHELESTIEQNNQAMIFINRRGFSSFLRCTECGYVPKCTECDVSLVYHKHDEQLKCHFCNKRYAVLNKCPECGGTKLREGGVGTQKIVEELKTVFPHVKILRMDNDTTSNKNAHSRILSEFANTKPSILVGTQMIAKGHDFPSVTLVGIIDADLSLHFSDYRATERTFQLITQVAGRAGRDNKTGKVILQTYTPKHYVYNFAKNYDYKAFFEKEINLRRTTNFPPYAKIVRVLVSGEDDKKTQNFLIEFYDKIKEIEKNYKSDFLYLEAMKSPVKRIKAKFRYQILMRLKLEHERQILNEIFYINDQMKGRSVISFVEIEPQNLS